MEATYVSGSVIISVIDHISVKKTLMEEFSTTATQLLKTFILINAVDFHAFPGLQQLCV